MAAKKPTRRYVFNITAETVMTNKVFEVDIIAANEPEMFKFFNKVYGNWHKFHKINSKNIYIQASK